MRTTTRSERVLRLLLSLSPACLAVAPATSLAQTVGGSAVQHQTLTIEWEGPALSELGGANPFTDRRLDVEFTGPGGTFTVPGYYAVDQATGADVWRVHFTAPSAGQWSYTPRFWSGANVAVADAAALGAPGAAEINGQSGTVNVAPLDAGAPGFLAKGMLTYTGAHYLRFADGDYYIKGGADSPENLLGYAGFDNTTKGPNGKGILHTYATHVGDWTAGDPDWDSDDADTTADDGRGIIGALNYLHSLGEANYTGPAKVNSVYFLPMNTGGDAQDTHPWASTSIDQAGSAANDNLRYDLSKLAQWETAFAHAQRKGIMLHFVLNEAETPNKNELDNATLGTERKLFYRELIARFGHHQALVWNVTEEYNLGNGYGANNPAKADTAEAFADWIKALDPYGHPVTVHNAGNPNPAGGPTQGTWQYFLGDESFDLTSLQLINNSQTLGDAIEAFRTATTNAGRPIPIMIDEPAPLSAMSAALVRKRMTWDIMLSGGHVEWYVSNADQSLDNFRTYEQVYEETFYARRLLEQHTKFWEMQPGDELLTGEDAFDGDADPGEVFYKQGEVYVLYLPDTDNQQTGALDLTADNAAFSFQWFDPTSGELVGGALPVTGGVVFDLPDTPGNNAGGENDWAALLRVVEVIGEDQLNAVLTHWASAVTPGDTGLGDFTSDGQVGIEDLDFVLARWNTPLIENVTVPEPASAIALLTGLGALATRQAR